MNNVTFFLTGFALVRQIAVLLAVCLPASLLLAVPAVAQDLFYDAPATINTDLSGHTIFIGKNNPDPFIVSVADGALLKSDSSFTTINLYQSSVLNVNGGYISGGTGITTNGNNVVNVTGGAIAGKSLYFGTGIRLGQIETLNITGGTITGRGTLSYGISASSTRGKSVAISGGVISATGTYANGIGAYGTPLENFVVSGGITTASGYRSAGIASSGSEKTISGGLISASGLYSTGIWVNNGEKLNITGGNIVGSYVGIEVRDGGAVTMSGGNVQGGISVYDKDYLSATMTFIGNDLTVTPLGTSRFTDSNSGYSGKGYSVTGTLSSGESLQTTVFAGDYTGDSSSLTFSSEGVSLDPDLYVTNNATVNQGYINLYIGRSEDGTTQSNPNVTLDKGAETTSVYVSNSSHLRIQGGITHDGISAGDNSRIDFAGGTLISALYGLVAGGNSEIIVSGGEIRHFGALLSGMTAMGNGQIIVQGGLVQASEDSVAAGIGDHGTLSITGGAIASDFICIQTSGNGTVDVSGGSITGGLYALNNSSVNLTGGSIDEIFAYDSSRINITGGHISDGTLFNLSADALYQLTGVGIAFSGAMAGVYDDKLGNSFTGVYWNLTGTLANGDALNTRYFIANGNFDGPTGVTITPTAAPEPASVALLLAPYALLGVVRAMRRKRCPQ